jgi:hypothetical protein
VNLLAGCWHSVGRFNLKVTARIKKPAYGLIQARAAAKKAQAIRQPIRVPNRQAMPSRWVTDTLHRHAGQTSIAVADWRLDHAATSHRR